MVFELVCTYLRSQKQRLSLLGLACLILRVFLSDVADSLTGPDAGEVPGGAYPSLTHIWLWAQHPWNQPVAPFLSFISRVIMEDTLSPAAPQGGSGCAAAFIPNKAPPPYHANWDGPRGQRALRGMAHYG